MLYIRSKLLMKCRLMLVVSSFPHKGLTKKLYQVNNSNTFKVDIIDI